MNKSELDKENARVLGFLAASIFHEVNNALNVVTGNLEILERRIPSDNRLESLIYEAQKGIKEITDLSKAMTFLFKTSSAVSCYEQPIKTVFDPIVPLFQISVGVHVPFSFKAEDIVLSVHEIENLPFLCLDLIHKIILIFSYEKIKIMRALLKISWPQGNKIPVEYNVEIEKCSALLDEAFQQKMKAIKGSLHSDLYSASARLEDLDVLLGEANTLIIKSLYSPCQNGQA